MGKLEHNSCITNLAKKEGMELEMIKKRTEVEDVIRKIIIIYRILGGVSKVKKYS